MTVYVVDDDSGLPICADCAVGACAEDAELVCDAEHCRCGCRDLAAGAEVAGLLDAERYDRAALIKERFGS